MKITNVEMQTREWHEAVFIFTLEDGGKVDLLESDIQEAFARTGV